MNIFQPTKIRESLNPVLTFIILVVIYDLTLHYSIS